MTTPDSPTGNAPSAYAVDGVEPRRVERPATVDELSRVLRDVHGANEAAIAWGGGTRMHVGNLPERYDVAVDLTRLDRIVDHQPSDLTVVAEAGVRVADLQRALAASRQRLALEPARPDVATMGGSLASNATGPVASSMGGIRDWTIGMTVVEPDGTITRSGGRVVKNVSGYDLVRLHIGAFGTLGVIAEAAFKLTPLPAVSRTVAGWFDSLDGAQQVAMELFNGPQIPEALSVAAGPRAHTVIAALAAGAGGERRQEYLVLARLSGSDAAVQRQIDDATAIMGAAMADGFEVLGTPEDGPAWEAATAGDESSLLSTRATFKPTVAFSFLSLLERAAAGSGLLLNCVLHAGMGTVLADWTAREHAADEALRHAIDAAVSGAKRLGATAVVERCPPRLKNDLDVWGEPGEAIGVMRRIKEHFDPARTLSPGRFAGRI